MLGANPDQGEKGEPGETHMLGRLHGFMARTWCPSEDRHNRGPEPRVRGRAITKHKHNTETTTTTQNKQRERSFGDRDRTM